MNAWPRDGPLAGFFVGIPLLGKHPRFFWRRWDATLKLPHSPGVAGNRRRGSKESLLRRLPSD
jgi:hypothetical protein